MSTRNDYQTPEWLLDIAREILGGIDLDPASSAEANERVRATLYFDARSNGLVQDWVGRVWLNPPYSTELLRAFVRKAIEERHRYTACLLLVNACPSTHAFHSLVHAARSVWFPARRINFLLPNGAPTEGNRYDQALFLLGGDSGHRHRFASALQSRGVVLPCYDRPGAVYMGARVA
jgi:hypothetical protein